MFQIRRMVPDDFQFAADLANTMNWNMTEGDFEFNRALEPNGCFVLVDVSKPIGIATCISYGRVGWFGNLIVKEDYRRRGAGSLLVKHAVNYLRSIGVTSVGLYAYEYLKDFYGNLGFRQDADFHVLRAEAVICNDKEGEANGIGSGDLKKIVEFDRECFGASRKRLLGKIVRQNVDTTFLAAAESGEIVGYGTAKIYKEMVEVGPLVCQRAFPAESLDLMDALLNKISGKEAYMCLSSTESALLDLATKTGFRKKFGVARMFLGSPFAQDCIYLTESLERG